MTLVNSKQLRKPISGSFTGSFSGDGSGLINISSSLSSSFATTASYAINATGSFIQGGNSFGAPALLGTNDTQNLTLETNNTSRVFISSSGNVGVGLASIVPDNLAVGNSISASFGITSNRTPGSISEPKYLDLNFRGYNNDLMARIRSWDESSNTATGYLTFAVQQQPSPGVWTFPEAMRINRYGNLLINRTTDAGFRLDVSGSTRITDGLTVTGSLNVNGPITSTGTLTVQTIVAQTITSSTELITGSTHFGTLMSNTHQFTGSVLVTGSVVVSGSIYGNSFFGDGAYLTNVGYIEKVFYVAEDGNDTNNGKTLNSPFRTIKAAAIAASASIAAAPPSSVPYRMTIRVEPGYYSEIAPITVPSNTSIIGNDLRTVVVRPTTATTGSNLFLVNNGDYFYGLRLEGCVIDDLEDPRNGFFFAFAPNAYISTSPYVQNCSAINTPFDKFYVPLDSGSANPLVGNGPGGMIVDDSVLNGYSPLKSMIVDAYTQVAFNGIGICVRGRGYAQMVSFFTNFSRIGTYCIDGGHASLLNSNTTFGDYGLRSKGLRLLVVPDISDISASIDANGSSLLKTYKSNIQNYMITQLSISGSYNTSYISGSGQYYTSTITDSGLLIDAISDDLLSPKSARLSQFIQGLFKAQDTTTSSLYTLPIASGSSFTQGVVTVIPQISNTSGSLTGDFVKSWGYMRDYIQNDPSNLFTAIGAGGKAKIQQSFNKVIDTITAVIVNAAGSQYIQEFGSLITSTSHDFSYSGAGVNFLALPVNQGGIGETNFDIRVIEEDGGRVYYTAGDETGDFYVGNDFIIRLATGTIEGRTFYKSVSAQITPLNLALETYS